MNVAKEEAHVQGKVESGLFQLIQENQIRQTRIIGGNLFSWITEAAGRQEAIKAMRWVSKAQAGDEYVGRGFKLRCLA